MAERVCLKPSADRKGRFSGYYECSLCGSKFRPNPKNPGEMLASFKTHTKFSHPREIALTENVNPPAPPITTEPKEPV